MAPVDPRASARAARLRYVNDATSPGIRRRGRPGHFRYVSASKKPVERRAVLERICSLAVPPAWTDVWICAKDFRTWSGTVLAARALCALREFKTKAEGRRNVVKAIESVARTLGNTKAVCRKSYIHPAILDGYMDGRTIPSRGGGVSRNGGLSSEERAVVTIVERMTRRRTNRRTPND